MPADINPTLQLDGEGPGGHLTGSREQSPGAQVLGGRLWAKEEGLSEILATSLLGHSPHTGAVTPTKKQAWGTLSEEEGLLPHSLPG